MLVGLEVELNSMDFSPLYIKGKEDLSYNEFKIREELGQVGVKMSEEYYNSTVEYNFTPFHNNEDTFKSIRNYINNQIDRYNLNLSGEQPAFIGTHIHLFDSDKISLNKPRLLKCILGFLLDNLDCLKYNSKIRLLLGHQLWGRWSYKNNHSWINRLHEYGLGVSYYESVGSKKKYGPIISSPETSRGKPKSLEIRIIPNEFIFNGKLFELLNEIETGKIYERRKVNVVDFIDGLCSNLDIKKEIRRNRYMFNEAQTYTENTYANPDVMRDEFHSLVENMHTNYNEYNPISESVAVNLEDNIEICDLNYENNIVIYNGYFDTREKLLNFLSCHIINREIFGNIKIIGETTFRDFMLDDIGVLSHLTNDDIVYNRLLMVSQEYYNYYSMSSSLDKLFERIYNIRNN